jgi:hypothetical protein
MRLYGIAPWDMDKFTQGEITAIGEEIEQMNKDR